MRKQNPVFPFFSTLLLEYVKLCDVAPSSEFRGKKSAT